jgi:predicted RNA-binding Zn ribbon-like protein
MEKALSVEEQDAQLLASLAQDEVKVTLKEEQNRQLKALLAEKKQLAQRLESFLREVEQESARIDQAIALMTQQVATR